MEFKGLKIVPILVSTVVVYVIGFLIYGVLFTTQFQEWSGMTPADMTEQMWKMSLGWIMPLALSTGIAMTLKREGITEMKTAIKRGLGIGIFLFLACYLYSFVYGLGSWQIVVLDGAHILLISMAAAAVLTAMKFNKTT